MKPDFVNGLLRKLEVYHPKLGAVVEGKFESNIRLMNYSPTVHEVLELGRGAAQLRSFIETYHKCVAEFGHPTLAQPVIVLIDNDDGGKKLFGLVKAKSGVEISYETAAAFYHLGLNLYLIKTPEQVAAPHTSCMENFFDPGVLATELDGKTFDPHKEHDAPGKYGKFAFATKVVERNANSIDFSGFAPLLERIMAVVDHYTESKKTSLEAAG